MQRVTSRQGHSAPECCEPAPFQLNGNAEAEEKREAGRGGWKTSLVGTLCPSLLPFTWPGPYRTLAFPELAKQDVGAPTPPGQLPRRPPTPSPQGALGL